jgi:hypothetical protein
MVVYFGRKRLLGTPQSLSSFARESIVLAPSFFLSEVLPEGSHSDSARGQGRTDSGTANHNLEIIE